MVRLMAFTLPHYPALRKEFRAIISQTGALRGGGKRQNGSEFLHGRGWNILTGNAVGCMGAAEGREVKLTQINSKYLELTQN